MRLTCPNCGARYEVDDALIPPEGRDVQCSNCTTTWFQRARRAEAAGAPPAAASGTASGAVPSSATPPRPTAPSVEVPAAAAEAAPSAPAAPAPEAAETPATVAPRRSGEAPARRELDPGVRDILRQEAEREARLRRGTPEPVETQQEMPLEEGKRDNAALRRRADLEGARDAFEAGDASGAPRRDLLPDIDEINSTLRAATDRGGRTSDAAETDLARAAARRRTGVRVGFILVLGLAVAGTWTYANPGPLGDMVPAAEPLLARYVEIVDAGRFWLDDLARSLAEGGGGS